MFHCSLKSGRMNLLAALMTDGNLSAHYKISFEGGLQNPVSWPVNSSSIK